MGATFGQCGFQGSISSALLHSYMTGIVEPLKAVGLILSFKKSKKKHPCFL